jgi:hypothetical protein
MAEPFEQLRDWLQWLRDGDRYHEGGRIDFTSAWDLAVPRVCRGRDAQFWRATFEKQRPTWRRAFYQAEPTPGEAGLGVLIGRLGLATIRERRCGFCGEPIPDDCRPEALFCCAKHRTAFHNRAKKTALQSQKHGSGEADADLNGEAIAMFAPTT